MNKCLIFFILLLCGCATSTPTQLPDGSVGYIVDCSSFGLTMGECIVKASSICENHGYEVSFDTSDLESRTTDAYTNDRRNQVMLIKCRNDNYLSKS